jgi:hypothetical protein
MADLNEDKYVERVDRMLNRWAGVKSDAAVAGRNRTRIEIGKEVDNERSIVVEKGNGQETVVVGKLFNVYILKTTKY